jgi:hypothetical protein
LARQAADFENEPRALPPVVATEAYGGAHVGFTGVVVTWQDTAPNGEMPTKAARLYHLEPWLRDGVVKSLPTEFWHAPDATQNTALQAGRGALLRCFVALDDGSFVQFPARGDLTRVDPRNRPWYRMAAENNELHWTRPVADATKRTLRVSALVGIRKLGVLAGVAGCDLRVAWLAKKLAVKLQGFRRAYLVAEDGKIVVSETLEAEVLPKVKNRDDDLALPPVDDPELARRIAGPDRGGYVRSGKRLFVFSKLISPAWTYVAELDPSHYFED